MATNPLTFIKLLKKQVDGIDNDINGLRDSY